MVTIAARTQIKQILRENKTGIDNLGGDFLDKLDDKIRTLVIDACKRAKENSRKTVMARDL
jgi:hypothetical protein